MQVEFEGSVNNNTGMVLDYFDVKDIVAPLVNELDHTVVIWEKDTILIEKISELNSAHVIVPFETTAENLVKYFLEKISHVELPKEIVKIKVRVCETENTYAEDSKNL